VIAKFTGSGEAISTYRVADTEMAVGSTIGAPKGTIILKANGAIERLFSSDAGEIAIGGMQIRYWDAASGVTLGLVPGEFILHPDRQEHQYELHNGLLVREQVFMLNGQPQPDRADPAIAYYHVELENPRDDDIWVRSIAAADMRGTCADDVRVRFDGRRRAFIATNRTRPDFARAFACSHKAMHWEVSGDHGKCSRVEFPGPLADRVLNCGPDHIALFEHQHHVPAKSTVEITYTLSATAQGVRAQRAILDRAPDARKAAARTRERYDAILRRAVVMTPDADVNRGVLWAKANMLRVETLAPTGWCFVNDPTRSNNSVGRDTAWFAFGSDYVMPDFARESLLAYVDNMERKGMVVEYYDIRTGKTADYKLNINDDTPLLMLALWHHYATTGNRPFLRSVYKGAKRAADYILEQRNGEGLVWCKATGTGDWGICGWRNVIQGYRISGASTELNSECYAALGAVSKMAAALGKMEDRDRFAREAEALRESINTHLVDPDTGLYYLNIDVDGTKRTNVTCDLVFPVMFGVADRERAARIISRLSVDAFWTDAGMRTVPRDDINYGPTHGHGLLGGVWEGATFWYAFAAARFNSDFMASALRDSFRHYSSDPRRNNTVPGQFSEWLHGETLVNQGMMLSPWFPPRYLWAAVAGAGGLDLTGDEPACNPRLAPDWRWLGVRRIRYGDSYISWFVVRSPALTMYATFRFKSELDYHTYDDDMTDELLDAVSDDVSAILLARGDELVLFVGNTAERTVSTSIVFKRRLESAFSVRFFNSMRGEWVDGSDVTGDDLYRGIPMQVERRGFCVVEIRTRA